MNQFLACENYLDEVLFFIIDLGLIGLKEDIGFALSTALCIRVNDVKALLCIEDRFF